MDYCDVNTSHFGSIRSIHVDKEGRAEIVLRDGSGIKAKNADEADEKLKGLMALGGKGKES